MNKEMVLIFKKLKEIDLKNSKVEHIESILNSLEKALLPFTIIDFEVGCVIIRSREIFNGDKISTKEDLSYVPKSKNKSYGRASTPDQTMFYGVINEDTNKSTISALFESSDYFSTKLDNKDPNFVVGHWKIKQKLSLVSFLLPSHKKSSKIFRENESEYNTFVNQNTHLYDKDDVLNILRFIDNEFTKSANGEYDYYITALLTKRLINKRNDIDGIIYQSLKSQQYDKLKESVCLAIKPSSVDTKLEFIEQDMKLYSCSLINNNMCFTMKKFNFDK